MRTEHELTIGKSILYTAAYFGVMLLYTLIDISIWRNIAPSFSRWLNLFTMIVFSVGYLFLLMKQTGFRIQLLYGLSFLKVLVAIGCSFLFFLLFDNFLDPIFEGLFPESELQYQEAIKPFKASPITSFIHVVIFAPLIEEILMRGFVLGGLRNKYGTAIALIISSLLFAILHFNMVQTLSALISGLILGLLYIKTNSILCPVITHCGYNAISLIVLLNS